VSGPFGSGNLGFQQQLANMVSRGEILPALLFSLGINPAGGLGAGPTVGKEILEKLQGILKPGGKLLGTPGSKGVQQLTEQKCVA